MTKGLEEAKKALKGSSYILIVKTDEENATFLSGGINGIDMIRYLSRFLNEIIEKVIG